MRLVAKLKHVCIHHAQVMVETVEHSKQGLFHNKMVLRKKKPFKIQLKYHSLPSLPDSRVHRRAVITGARAVVKFKVNVSLWRSHWLLHTCSYVSICGHTCLILDTWKVWPAFIFYVVTWEWEFRIETLESGCGKFWAVTFLLKYSNGQCQNSVVSKRKVSYIFKIE